MMWRLTRIESWFSRKYACSCDPYLFYKVGVSASERDVDSDGAFQLFCSIRGLEVIDAFL